MPKSIVICEKTTQAQSIRAAVGSQYGEVYPASGHLLELALPDDIDPAWGWNFHLLRPDASRYKNGFYPSVPTKSTYGNPQRKLADIKNAIKDADVVYIATDCDREGQLIGDEILEYCRFKGKAFRAMFTADDKKTIADAFKNAKPNSEYARLCQAAIARQQSDQIANLSLTRAATCAFRKPGVKAAVGIGRVKTPTMAIVCRRELEIKHFKPQDYFDITVDCKVAAGIFQMSYKPRDYILDRAIAEAIAASAAKWSGPLKVDKKIQQQSPTKLFDLPTLQKVCSSKFNLSPEQTLNIAQKLYSAEGGALTTYPRSAVRYLAETQIDDAKPICRFLASLPSIGKTPAITQALATPQIRNGKSGAFYTKGLAGESHTAIIPNVNTLGDAAAHIARLSEAERKVYFLIARSYAAMMMPDFVYEQTSIQASVPHNNEAVNFAASGRKPISLGWRELFENGEDDDAEEGLLPEVKNGETGTFSNPIVEKHTTKPPPRYTAGTLLDRMVNAWEGVADPTWRDRLKEAKGIGTPATRDQVIAGLLNQGLIVKVQGASLGASEAAMELYELLQKIAPQLINPAITAVWEMQFDAILAGTLDAKSVVDRVCTDALKHLDAFKTNAKNTNGNSRPVARPSNGGPTEKMLKFAEMLAQKKKEELPETARTNFEACKIYIDRNAAPAKPGASNFNRKSSHGKSTGKTPAASRKTAAGPKP